MNDLNEYLGNFNEYLGNFNEYLGNSLEKCRVLTESTNKVAFIVWMEDTK